MPNLSLNRSAISRPSNIALADPQFDKCRKIDALLGAGLFWKLLCIGQHKAGPELLWQKTLLGWVLGGKTTGPIGGPLRVSRCNLATNKELLGQVEAFWKIEELGEREQSNDTMCEQHFVRHTRRDTSGRYVVRIPFRDNVQELGQSREQATRRFYSLERKLRKNPELRDQYINFMEEYEALGHMSRISMPSDGSEPSYYLPHHAVVKESSTTTKVRVVFDGSAKTSSGLSLNNTQWVGPTIQSDLIAILVRFRQHRYVLSADIAKMYRQVLVHPKDRRFQRVLWRPSTESPIQTFKLNTVTYGTASAPFLATRVLHQLGLDCKQRSPIASRIILNDFYIDDLLTGAQSVLEIGHIKREVSSILEQAGFQLRKWATNCPSTSQTNSDSTVNKDLNVNNDPKILGISWSSVEDVICFSVTSSADRRITKRTILSEIAQIFDPLGLLGPVITTAKLIMQRLWQCQAGWDESVSQELHAQWAAFRNELQAVNRLKIPRCVTIENVVRVELHGFADASEKAYGACVYLRSQDASGNWAGRLLCAKSRVAPLRAVSLPRLELCGALLLARLMQKVKLSLTIKIHDIGYWSDSTIAIAWIRGPPRKWNTFVANRVAEMQVLTDNSPWWHVKSRDNPADLISRGVTSTVLIDAQCWWTGPTWLGTDKEHWPHSVVEPTEVPEERKVKQACNICVEKDFSIFRKYSSYARLRRVFAYCLRFINNARNKTNPQSRPTDQQNPLSTSELREAEEWLIRGAQREIFSEEISMLRENLPVQKSSPLISLNPFLDSTGLIRVGGRLSKAPIDFSKKHPMVLPARHPLTDLIIVAEHMRLLHGGCALVTASLRERFWPLQCRRNVRRILGNCVRCFRVRPQGTGYKMGDLPAARVTPARPFYTCGIDYAGPFLTKDRPRSKVTTKSYLCLFVCFVTKAVHLELATDLSTQAFLNCFRRFIARRGRCRCIMTDNGTNFIGAKNELRDLGILVGGKEHNAKISNFLSSEQIEWRLIPPQSPHFGGLWEGGVKSTKYHLKRVIGDQRLTFEELYTLLTQVESCLNSRPLTPLSSDPTDLNPLTPGHFLIGDAITALPDHDFTEVNQHRLGRYQLIQKMFQHFWARWQQEYLHQLQQRTKWRLPPSHALVPGTMVIIKDDRLPPLQWSLGRIVQLHEGTDGGVRVVSIKTADGIFKRPVNKLCILPLEEADHKDN